MAYTAKTGSMWVPYDDELSLPFLPQTIDKQIICTESSDKSLYDLLIEYGETLSGILIGMKNIYDTIGDTSNITFESFNSLTYKSETDMQIVSAYYDEDLSAMTI